MGFRWRAWSIWLSRAFILSCQAADSLGATLFPVVNIRIAGSDKAGGYGQSGWYVSKNPARRIAADRVHQCGNDDDINRTSTRGPDGHDEPAKVSLVATHRHGIGRRRHVGEIVLGGVVRTLYGSFGFQYPAL